MILGGRVATLGQWRNFDRQWNWLLKKSGLEYFHAKEFRSRSKEFAGWGEKDCNAFLTKAQQVVVRNTLCGFCVRLKEEDYRDVYRAGPKPKKLKLDSKYGLCFRLCLLQVPRTIRREFPRQRLRINFVLESGDPGSGDAKAILDDAKEKAPPELADILGVLTYGRKTEFAGLQAADLIAFSAYRVEGRNAATLTALPKKHTITQAQRLAKYKSPVYRLDLDAAVINELKTKALADIERRRNFWERRNTVRFV